MSHLVACDGFDPSGTMTLNLLDTGDTTGTGATITGLAVTGLDFGAGGLVNYTGVTTATGGVTGLNVIDGSSPRFDLHRRRYQCDHHHAEHRHGRRHGQRRGDGNRRLAHHQRRRDGHGQRRQRPAAPIAPSRASTRL